MGFLTLLAIELKRSRVWLFVAILVAAIAVTDMRRFFEASYGGVTWFWIGGAARTLTGTFPFGVAFAAWYAGRSRRNRLNEVDVSNRWFGLGSHATALTAMIAMLLVTIVPVFVVVSVRTRNNSIAETGTSPIGPYPWLQIVVIFIAFAAFVIWGYWFGYQFKSLLGPIAAATAMMVLLQVPQRTLFEGDIISPLGAIIPTQINYQMAPYIGDRVYLPLAIWGIAWFALLGLIPMLLLRKWGIHRKRAVLQTGLVCVLAALCAVNVSSALQSAGSWHAEYRVATCIEQSGIEFCSPPGAMTTTDLEAVAAHYDALIPNWVPGTNLPETMSVPISGDQLPAGAVSMVQFQFSHQRNALGYMQAMLFLIAGPGVVEFQPNATQMVVACAMLLDTSHDCGPTYPNADFQYVPRASNAAEGQDILRPIMESGRQPTDDEAKKLESDLADLQSLTQQKLDNFMALSDDEKTAWLEENWDRLSSGDLTLDDMP